MAKIAESDVSAYRAEMAEHLTGLAPAHAQAMGPQALDSFIAQAMERAESYGILEYETVRTWLELSMLWGIGFDTDPTYKTMTRALNEDWPDLLRMRALHREAMPYYERVYGADRTYFTAMLRRVEKHGFRPLPDSPPVTDDQIVKMLSQLWPERAEQAGEDALLALTAIAGNRAMRLGMESNTARVTLTIMLLLLGSELLNDPQYRWFAASLERGDTPENRLESLSSRARAYVKTVLSNA